MSDSTVLEAYQGPTGHLAIADQHVALGEQVLAKQRALVERLKSKGRDAAFAEELLEQFERALRSYVADRDQIRMMYSSE
jgi:hypothetical protein